MLRRKLSKAEIIAAAGVAAALTVAGWCISDPVLAAYHWRQARADWPEIVARAQAQCDRLSAVIEEYRKVIGAYPPDHRLALPAAGVCVDTNQLLAELSGAVRYTNRVQIHGMDPVQPADLLAVFGTNGLLNSVTAPAEARGFLTELTGWVKHELHDDPDVFGLKFGDFPEDLPVPAMALYTFSPWCYVSSTPTNNPGRFDLWMEISLGGRRTIVSNWKRTAGAR
jgi:hypothetical protein